MISRFRCSKKTDPNPLKTDQRRLKSSEKILISGILVEGSVRISEEDIIRNARLWQGKEIDLEDIQKSVKNLFDS